MPRTLTTEQLAALRDAGFAADNLPVPGLIFTADEVENIRKEEKTKLYPEIEAEKQRTSALSSQLEQYEKERTEAARLAAEQQHQEAEARRLREEQELSAHELILRKEDEFNQKLSAAETEWNTRLTALQQQADADRAALAMEARYQELQTYKNRRLAEHQDTIVPNLITVLEAAHAFGSTEEEIDRSISTLVTESSAILESIQQSMPTQRVRGIPTTGGMTSGPLEQQQQQTITDTDIKNMSMKDWQQHREKILASTNPYR